MGLMAVISMDRVPFAKMSGSGNDFILIDNRGRVVPEAQLAAFIAGICRRRLSAGADGVILIEASETADFRWRFFNSDASPAEMCGNGARCAARFAFLQGICGAQLRFETDAGMVEARVAGTRVQVKMPDPQELTLELRIDLASGPRVVSSVNTGVPHAVVLTDGLAGLDVAAAGREIRFHPRFAPAGTNVNFICRESGGGIAVRTYERGVEGETLACGTGAAAAALVAAAKLGLASPVSVATAGGERLTVYFEHRSGSYRNLRQEGGARLIYTGVLLPEAWQPDSAT
jgi:diaminopimelate epimerase